MLQICRWKNKKPVVKEETANTRSFSLNQLGIYVLAKPAKALFGAGG
jgi:hypothetical protein